MITRIKLKTPPDDNCILIFPIVTYLETLPFVHLINKTKIFNFSNYDDFLYEENSIQSLHLQFYFNCKLTETEFYLIKNKGTKLYVMKNYKPFEYILILKNLDECFDPIYIETIKKLEFVQTTLSLKFADLKSNFQKYLNI